VLVWRGQHQRSRSADEATFKVDFVLLTGLGDDGRWGRELGEEQKGRDEIQERRVARVCG
jgi:hypothetical protein